MKTSFLLPALICLGAATSAHGAVVTGTVSGGTAFAGGGTFQLIPAPAAVGDNNQQSLNLFAWNERQSVVLGAALAVNTGAPIAAGTRVHAHGIVFDPLPSRSIIGSVTFSAPILGVIWSRNNLLASDFLGLPGTTYNSPAARGLEAGDIAGTSFSGKTLFIDAWTASNPGDNIRVITAVPEASTWAMLIAGFGLVGFAARRRTARLAA